MLRPTRQCLSRWPIRFLLLATVALAIFWAFIAGSSAEYPCSSSKQCYQVFVNKARQMGSSAVMEGAARRQRQAASFVAAVADRFNDKLQPSYARGGETASSSSSITSNSDAAVASSSSSSSSRDDIQQSLSPEEAEYARLTDASQERVKAAFVVLARNQEIYSLRSSMRHLEDRFNHKYNYPWIFLNEQPFTDEFKNLTRQMTKAEVHYGLVPEEHWSYPEWINQTYAAQCRQEMANMGVVYGGSESYRHMCRYQSGFFMMHPLLDGLEYYWRVEPGVSFSCDIDYDPFRLMKERDLKYGFTIALQELYYTIPTLWDKTVEYMKLYPQYIYDKRQPDSLFDMITNDNGWTYNLCHFWSNFEIASVSFMRSEAYQSYFRFLDEAGGFFYERWGDAPVHSIAVALMLRKKDVHWFYDIGYKHDFFEHCPTEPAWLVHGKCYCDPNTSFDYTEGSCMSRFLHVTNRTATSYIVTLPDKDD